MDAPWLSFLDCLEKSVREFAGSPALATENGASLTYREVMERVRGLSYRLVTQGITPGSLLAINLPRSIDFVTTALACWQRGCAYLPLDPAWPERRRQAILAEAMPTAVIEKDDSGLASVTSEPYHSEPISLTPETLAYVIYTSGSMGRPKGVAVTHRGPVNLFAAQIEAFDLRPGDRSLWLLNPAFDASLSDIGTALLSGGSLVCAGDESARDPRRLLRTLHAERITHVDLPPSLLSLIDPASLPPTLRTVVVGGEPSPIDAVRLWAERVRVVNVYGPTEATICTSLCVCEPQSWSSPLLGQPIPGIRYHVLQEDHQALKGPGTGELAIEGIGLARGYLHQPELTASKFITLDGRRVYLTGDRVCRRADGEYEFLGRIDRQVKIHGRLIEPEEIEVALRCHPDVERAAVLASREGLAACVLARRGLTEATIRSFLETRVPAWMVPSRIHLLAELPVTPSGKIDYARLGSLIVGTARPLLTRPPLDVLTGRLVELCGEALDTKDVDPDAGFVEQGGDSLSAIHVVAKAAAAGLLVSPTRLLSARSLREIGDQLGRERPAPGVPGAIDAATLRRDVESMLANIPFPHVAPRPSGPPTKILLTGGTGWLGSHLLRELLDRCGADVVCLVRSDSATQARQRLLAAIPKQRERDDRRIDVEACDLSRPHFGLSADRWGRLADSIDTIYHCGARVHLLQTYDELRDDNLTATATVLRLAATGCAKRVHFASTLSVFVATDRNVGTVFENDHLRDTRVIHGGYAQTKWAAEWLVRQAKGRAGPVAVYRPGLITGDFRTGTAAPGDFLTLFLRGLAQLGCIPDLDAGSLRLDVTPVDYAATALAHLSLHAAGDEDGVTFHLAGSASLSLAALLAGLCRRGAAIETVSLARWHERLAALQRTDGAAAAAVQALCRGLPGGDSFRSFRLLDLFQATGVNFDQANTRAGLAGTGIACPPPDDALLERYLDFAFK